MNDDNDGILMYWIEIMSSEDSLGHSRVKEGCRCQGWADVTGIALLFFTAFCRLCLGVHQSLVRVIDFSLPLYPQKFENGARWACCWLTPSNAVDWNGRACVDGWMMLLLIFNFSFPTSTQPPGSFRIFLCGWWREITCYAPTCTNDRPTIDLWL